jgi:plasmid stabilization system protein ParE
MKAQLSKRADRDLVERIGYYRTAGGDKVAQRFFDAAVRSLSSIERSPGRGSLEIGQRCDIAGLRSSPIKGFPVRLYYLVSAERLFVLRVLADAQDILTILANDEVDLSKLEATDP